LGLPLFLFAPAGLPHRSGGELTKPLSLGAPSDERS